MRQLASVVLVPLMLTSLLAPGLSAQAGNPAPPTRDSVTVTPGSYSSGGLLMGRGHRELWTTPIRVPVADLTQWGGGGLTPFDVGGGTATQTLHVRGANGFRYVMRSVDKSPRGLAPELQGTPVEDIVQDQMSSFHPTGAVVVARLLEAVGVLHPEPLFAVIPDSPLLGEYREEFGGMLVLFEERPDDLPDGAAGFAGSTDIVGTDDLFDELEENPGDRVDLVELLKSRLIDLLIGDPDRSDNNHLWARFDDVGGGNVWRPIPRDRDLAFVQFDGVLKSLARRQEPRLIRFRGDYPNMRGLTRAGWDIDRNLLVGLDLATWNATVQEVVEAITDGVITDAVSRLPPEHHAIAGAELEETLRSRRTALPEAAGKLYEIVFEYADIHATDEDEVASIELLADGRVRIAVNERGPNSSAQGSAHFDRVFSPAETREIRLYLHGGDDVARVSGADSPIKIRLIGGGGEDEFANSSAESGIRVRDEGAATTLTGSGMEFTNRAAPRPWSWTEGEPRVLDWGSYTLPETYASYDRDRGLLLRVGLNQTRYGFQNYPFSSRTQARVGWAFGRSKAYVDLRQYFQGLFRGSVDLALRGRFSGLDVLHFYGFGNDSPGDLSRKFYNVDQNQLTLSAMLSFGDGETTEVAVGPVFKRTTSDTTVAATLINAVKPYGSGTFLHAGLQATLDLEGRDHLAWPTSGYHVTAGAAYYPSMLDLTGSVVEAHGQVAAYVSPSGGNPTLATRVGGKHVWGTFPYTEAAFLGGSDNIRGLRDQRYGGRSAVYGSAELRVEVGRFFLVFPADFGVFGFADVGRVVQDDLSSGTWHKGYGGGIWVAPVMRETTFRVSVGKSEGRTAFYLGLGFSF